MVVSVKSWNFLRARGRSNIRDYKKLRLIRTQYDTSGVRRIEGNGEMEIVRSVVSANPQHALRALEQGHETANNLAQFFVLGADLVDPYSVLHFFAVHTAAAAGCAVGVSPPLSVP
jgi:hypothetical protein